MKRVVATLIAVLLAAGVVATEAVSTSQGGDAERTDKRKADAIDSYCSPTGDYCLAVTERRGRIKLEISTFSFRGRYKLCVRGPERKVCKHFRLSKAAGDTYADRVNWARKFGDQGPGRYKAVWKLDGNKLGKSLRFRPHRRKAGTSRPAA